MIIAATRRMTLAAAALVGLMAASACASGAAPGKNAMVAAADPRAVEAGLDILRQGGNAVDAAVAVQTVLGLVEPQSSGLGGGAIALVWSAKEQKLYAYDGREVAPASATPELFLNADGKPLSRREAVLGGKSVGVPGAVAMLEMMHKDLGALEWAKLFDTPAEMAENGFAVGPRLAYLLKVFPFARQMKDTRAYFYDENGEPWAEGALLRNPDYASTVRTIAREGATGFYTGPLAEAIAERVSNAENHPTEMTLEDLANYEPKRREAVCTDYRVWEVCGFPPPTSGGVAVAQMLGLLERFDLSALEPGSSELVHLVAEASRLAYADRELYLGDADFVKVPVSGLVDRRYLTIRSRLINERSVMNEAPAGDPYPYMSEDRTQWAPDVSPEVPGTSHFTIVDAEGNIVSMTTTIEGAFGSHLMAGGFLLNNELTDFSFEPVRDGKPVANAVAAGKRPRSSMSPVIVFGEGRKPELAVGSPGGSRIPLYVLKAVIASLDLGLPMQEAVALPNFGNRGFRTEIEKSGETDELQNGLEALGHRVSVNSMTSGLHGIRFTEHGLEGGADPRRDGAAMGLSEE